MSFLKRTTRFVLFFDESITGLNIGSSVKLRGVPVGIVQDILIRVEGQVKDSTAIPVIIKINRSRLKKDLGVSSGIFEPEFIQESIERGLVAQLSLESFVTGQLFVEFSFQENLKNVRFHLSEPGELVEIPTLTSSLDQIGQDLEQLVSNIGVIDLKRLNENLNSALEGLTAVLEGIDAEAMSTSVVQAADAINNFVRSHEFAETLFAIQHAFEQVTQTAESLNVRTGPIGETLNALERLVNEANTLLHPGSDTHFEFQKTLRQLGLAAQSLHRLTDYLERNPNARAVPSERGSAQRDLLRDKISPFKARYCM